MSESALDRKVFGQTTVEKAVYVAVFLVAVFLSTYQLGVRPYHHDESIHAFFSWKITQEGLGNYRYDPVYHGPVLYYSSALVMRLFGDSDFTGRLSAVLFGLGVIAFSWPLRRYLGRWGALAFLVLLTFSPAWIYFTRFVRHDIYLALCNVSAVYFAFRYGETRRAWHLYVSAASLSLAFCTKEDMYLLSPLFLLSLALMEVWGVLGGEQSWRDAVKQAGAFLRSSLIPILTSLAVFAVVWLILYTSFGTHPENWNAVSRAIEYWWGQHQIKRIGGPWWYYVPQLLLYDVLLVAPLAIALAGRLLLDPARKKAGRYLQYAAFVILAAFLISFWIIPSQSSHFFLAAIAVGTASVATGWVPDRFTRFSILWALGALSIYAWAQEKVPWLLVPQLLPLALFAGKWFGELIESGKMLRPRALVPTAAVGVMTAWSLVQANYVWDAPKPDEPGPKRHAEMLAYVQSTYDITNKVVRRIEDAAQTLGTGTQTRLAVGGEATWPLSWYLRHYPVNWAANVRTIDTPVVVVDKKPELMKAMDEAVGDQYEKVPFQIRGWWEPNWGQFWRNPLAELVRFVVTREAWSPVGSSDAVMYVHKDLKAGMSFASLAVNPPPAARGYPRQPDVIEPDATWGSLGSGRGELNEPRDVDVDAAGNLYVVDSKNHRIQKLSPAGEVLAVWGGEGSAPGQFKDPCGLGIGPDGSVYVADTWNHRIQKFDPNGTFLLEWSEQDPNLWGPRGIAVGADGTVFVSDTGNKRIIAYSSTGARLRIFGSEGSQPAQLIEPVGLAINDSGELIVADTGNRRLQVFTQDGAFVREWPVFGWEEFYTEPYVAVQGGDIYVTDSYNHRFARYMDNKLTGVWGKTGAGSGAFNRPIGIAVAGGGFVYVADTLNHRIQRFRIPE
jgi:uncharacterized protein (TIGR03663 family)